MEDILHDPFMDPWGSMAAPFPKEAGAVEVPSNPAVPKLASTAACQTQTATPTGHKCP